MYLPEHFRDARPEALAEMVQRHPLGLLVTHGPAGLDANPLPWLYDTGADDGALGTLRGHVARANPLGQPGLSAPDALVVFSAEQGYISPSWYPSKAEAHRQVPTWNYRVLQARGTLTVHDDPRWLRALLARLTRTHEAAEPRPWRMGDAPADYLDQLLANIVGVELRVTGIAAKAKLSQNKSEADRRGAADALDARGHAALAAAMRHTLPRG